MGTAPVVFLDRSGERNQGELEIEVPQHFQEALDALLKKLRSHPNGFTPVLANMAAFLHLRHDDGAKKYLLGWRKTTAMSKYPAQLEKYFYINRHAMEEIGLLTSDSFAALKRFLAEGGFQTTGAKEDRDNLRMSNTELSVQAEIIGYITEQFP